MINQADIEKFKKGDLHAFEHIYEQTKTFIYRVILRMTGNREDAYDYTHDVYVKLFEKRASYQPRQAIEAWIYRIAVNHVLNAIRKKKWFALKQGQIRMFYQSEPESLYEEEEGLLTRLLQTLPLKYRLPVILKDLEERSHEEIAVMLNLKIGTLKSRISRGRRKLLSIYQKEGGKK